MSVSFSSAEELQWEKVTHPRKALRQSPHPSRTSALGLSKHGLSMTRKSKLTPDTLNPHAAVNNSEGVGSLSPHGLTGSEPSVIDRMGWRPRWKSLWFDHLPREG